ncbi:hypothetical protein [Cellulosimicrobium protaetiae]|uniref:Uncharacterized protein n=1 Tax=Cellulosimicrobium protaetiae TaxID=2587808 RepID=A0A6M5UF13_9MICO|nr:hypothetical protein [Cellulosimicrobium protaetiae]QJW35708.1 hypothetical protein FIC82_005340 [Cellulosimicrobium protaetiae]
MTATTHRSAERRAIEAAAHRRGVRAVARYYAVGTWYVGLWFWAIALAVGALILWIMERNDDVSIEAVGGVAGSAKFFLFVMGIILPLMTIAVHVASGGTRRSYTHGLWIGATVSGLSFGLASALVKWGEWTLFRRAGWSTAPELGQLYGDGSQVGLVLLVEGTFCTVYYLAGMVIAAGFYGFGFLRGVGLVLVSLLPVVVTEVFLRSGFFGHALARVVGLDGTPVWLAVLGGLLGPVLAALLLRGVLRGVAIRPVEFAASASG